MFFTLFYSFFFLLLWLNDFKWSAAEFADSLPWSSLLLVFSSPHPRDFFQFSYSFSKIFVILLKYFLFVDNLIFFMHYFLEIIEYLYDAYFEFLSDNSYTCFLRICFWRIFYSFYWVTFPCFLCHCNFVLGSEHLKKIATSPRFYSLSWPGKDLHQSAKGELSNLLCGCIFFGFMHVNPVKGIS